MAQTRPIKTGSIGGKAESFKACANIMDMGTEEKMGIDTFGMKAYPEVKVNIAKSPTPIGAGKLPSYRG